MCSFYRKYYRIITVMSFSGNYLLPKFGEDVVSGVGT